MLDSATRLNQSPDFQKGLPRPIYMFILLLERDMSHYIEKCRLSALELLEESFLQERRLLHCDERLKTKPPRNKPRPEHVLEK